jgi:hypothetical protein
MRRALLLSVLLLACAHKSGGAESAVIRDETVKEDQAELALELAWRAVAPRQVELVLKMRVIGIVETNKLVAEVYINGFNVEDGHTRWDGFVPPRDPQKFRVVLSIPEGSDEATARVMLSRSNDSNQLLREELNFSVDAAGKVTLSR